MSQFTLLGKSMVKLKLLKTFFKFTLIFTFKKIAFDYDKLYP